MIIKSKWRHFLFSVNMTFELLMGTMHDFSYGCVRVWLCSGFISRCVRHGQGEYFVDIRLLTVDRKSHDYGYEKKKQEYLTKIKHYLRLENKANKDKVLLYYKILRYIYIDICRIKPMEKRYVKLADQLLFKTRCPKKWINIQEAYG